MNESMNLYYDFATSNKSFINMHKLLKDKGILNNKFMLNIFNTNLINVDPFNPNLTDDQINTIKMECTINPWYFLREVVRIPDIEGKVIRYKLDPSNIAQAHCMFCGFDTWTTKPRFNQLTVSSLLLLIWKLLFRNRQSINIQGKILNAAKLNIEKISVIIENLPDYLKFHNPNKELIRNNTSTIYAKSVNNYVRTRTDNFIGNINYIDDAAFIKNIKLIILDAKKSNGQRIITSTRNFYGKNTEKPIIDNSLKWNDLLFDANIEDIKYIVNATRTGLIYIEHNYKDLGLDEEWVKQQECYLNGSTSFEGEVLLLWKEQ
jgi:hypothetical protein